MTKEQLTKYLKENLRIIFQKDDYPEQYNKITIFLILDDEEISRGNIYIREGR